uniref:Yip1 domain family, member 2 n=1 Tax=Sinocyclocheilus grahami TaxID=75366 RepID=A0A672T4T9_SINGR
PSEIIIICRFAAQDTFLIINVENSCLLGGEKQTGGFWTFEYYVILQRRYNAGMFVFLLGMVFFVTFILCCNIILVQSLCSKHLPQLLGDTMQVCLFSYLVWYSFLSGYTFLETVCVYGYSLFIYIPTSISWTISVYWLEWLLIVIAMVISGSVLVMTFWPAICDDTKLTAFATMAVIVSLHALLAVGFKVRETLQRTIPSQIHLKRYQLYLK